MSEAPTLPTVLRAIQTEIDNLLRLADAVAAGRVPLSDFQHIHGRPGEADALLALMLNHCSESKP